MGFLLNTLLWKQLSEFNWGSLIRGIMTYLEWVSKNSLWIYVFAEYIFK